MSTHDNGAYVKLRGELARTLQPMVRWKDYTASEDMVRVLMPKVEGAIEDAFLAGWRTAMTEAKGGDWSQEFPSAR